ncbi:aKG-HExxH-type peptide beta-hydroxylase [Paraherbaspirillum soli]|uniref:HEXXH motif-containing putative peptide modification protein n=1 Tax=Paraherbaspirillum soli TaxID=631222 RepID=A0ABW0M8S1_9BURK
MGPNILLDVVSAVLDQPVTAGDLASSLHNARYTYLARLLHYRIATLPDPKDIEQCLTLLQELSEQAATDVLRSPAMCQLLRIGSGGEQSIKDLLKIAHATDSGQYLDAWSLLGDVWLGQDVPPGCLPLEYQDKRFCGPRLACGLPLDLSLPAALEIPSAGLQRPRLLSRHDTNYACECLDAAVEILETSSPLGHSIFSMLATNLVLRTETSRPSECWGATSGAAIGRIVVVNAAAAAHPKALAEVLLHEATHCAIDCAELSRPLVQWHAASTAGNTIPSPWTGNPLTPHAYIHACIVWVTLLEYWHCYRRLYGEDEISRARLLFIERGFKAMDGADHLGSMAGQMSDFAPQVVNLTRESARAAFSN